MTFSQSIASSGGSRCGTADSCSPSEPPSGTANSMGGNAIPEPKRSRPFAATAASRPASSFTALLCSAVVGPCDGTAGHQQFR